MGDCIPAISSDISITTDVVLQCQNCGFQRTSRSSTEPFLTISLGPNNTNIQSLVNNYYKSKEAENVKCSNKCNGDSATSKVIRKEMVEDPPNTLFIMLKRTVLIII